MKLKLNHLAIPYLALLAFLFGGMVISTGIPWYEGLVLPSWHPSPSLIAFVWAVIYVCAAWSLLIVWNQPERGMQFKKIMGGYICATGINLIWSIAFFHLHLFAPSVWFAFVLGLTALVLMHFILPQSKKAALLLAPYVLWVFFASYLTYVVMVLN
jgi:translocator protein